MKIMIKGFKNLDTFLNEKDLLPVEIDNTNVGAVGSDDNDAIAKIKKIASSNVGKTEVEKVLNASGVPRKQIPILLDLLMDGDWDKVSTYFMNRTLKINDILNKKINAYDINSSLLGLNGESGKDFFLFQWSTQPPMGKTEAWLMLMLAGGSKAARGDVIVDGKNLEVKGKGARLIGQSGYGDAKQMPKHFKNALLNIASDLKIENFTIIDGNSLAWQINKKAPSLLEDNLKELSSLKGGFKKNDLLIVSNRITESYKNLYTQLDTKKLAGMFIDAISSNGSIDYTRYNAALLKEAFKYYHQIEQFDYFAMTNDITGNVLIMEPSSFEKFVDNGEIKFGTPSWSEAAGTQGAAFSIAIDKLKENK